MMSARVITVDLAKPAGLCALVRDHMDRRPVSGGQHDPDKITALPGLV